MRFSPDGKHLAYLVPEGDKWRAVLDGNEGPKYDGIGEAKIVYSSDSKHAAYAAKKSNKWHVVLDGQEGPEYDTIIKNGPTFDAEGVLEYLATKDGLLYRVRMRPVR